MELEPGTPRTEAKCGNYSTNPVLYQDGRIITPMRAAWQVNAIDRKPNAAAKNSLIITGFRLQIAGFHFQKA